MVFRVQVLTVLAAVRSEANRESGLCISTAGLSNSATCWEKKRTVSLGSGHTEVLCAYLHLFVTSPLSMTSIRSAYITVLIRCAMVSMVQSWKASLIVFCIRASVSESMDAVASSKRMICWKTKRDR